MKRESSNEWYVGVPDPRGGDDHGWGTYSTKKEAMKKAREVKANIESGHDRASWKSGTKVNIMVRPEHIQDDYKQEKRTVWLKAKAGE